MTRMRSAQRCHDAPIFRRVVRAALAITAGASLGVVACRATPSRGSAPSVLGSTIVSAPARVPVSTTAAVFANGTGVAPRPPIGPCPGAENHPVAALIDDFEPAGPAGAWFSYSDRTPGGVLDRQVEPTAPGGRRALHVTARGWREWGAGIGVLLGAPGALRQACDVDASAYDGIRFRARGRGSLRVSVATTPSVPVGEGGACALGQACFDWPGRAVRLTAEWATIELPFCSLFPEGWGRDNATVDARRLYALHFRLGENQTHDLWVDDLVFLPRGAARDGGRCAPTCPLAATPADAILAPGQLSSGHAAEGLAVHTFEQPTKTCGSLTRRYLTYVPRRLPVRSSAPVLIALHGTGSSAESFRDFQTHARFEALAEREGFIVIYGNAAPGPATSARVPNSGAWHPSRTAGDEVDDLAYLDTVLDDLRSRQIIDGSNAIFLVGQSNGGGMVLEAARQRPDRYVGFAAFMPFAGLSPQPPVSLAGARLSRAFFAYSVTDPGLPPGYVEKLRLLVDGWAHALDIPPATIAAPARAALPDPVNEGAGYTGPFANALATRASRGEQLDLCSAAGAARATAVRVLVFDHAGHFWPHPVQDSLPFVLARWGLRNQDLDAADAVWSFFRDIASPSR